MEFINDDEYLEAGQVAARSEDPQAQVALRLTSCCEELCGHPVPGEPWGLTLVLLSTHANAIRYSRDTTDFTKTLRVCVDAYFRKTT